jgi:hypothetical protein
VIAHVLVKPIGKYLDSQRAQEAVENSFGLKGNRIRARISREAGNSTWSTSLRKTISFYYS